MTGMADRTERGGQERNRIKTLTQAALNADKTVEQVEDVLDNLSSTMKELSNSLSALNATVERMESGLDHLDGTLSSLDDLAKRLIVLVEPPPLLAQPASVARLRGAQIGPRLVYGGTYPWDIALIAET